MVELDDFYIFTANGWTRWLVRGRCNICRLRNAARPMRYRAHVYISPWEHSYIYIFLFYSSYTKRKQNLWGYPVLKLNPTERIHLCVPPWSAVTVGHVDFCGLGKAWNYMGDVVWACVSRTTRSVNGPICFGSGKMRRQRNWRSPWEGDRRAWDPVGQKFECCTSTRKPFLSPESLELVRMWIRNEEREFQFCSVWKLEDLVWFLCAIHYVF